MNIITLPFAETAAIDRGRWRALRVEFGSPGALAVVQRALAEIADSCARMHAASERDESGLAARQARRIGRIAGEIGLTPAVQVAADAALCAEAGDRIAVAAIGARLERIAHDVESGFRIQHQGVPGTRGGEPIPG